MKLSIGFGRERGSVLTASELAIRCPSIHIRVDAKRKARRALLSIVFDRQVEVELV